MSKDIQKEEVKGFIKRIGDQVIHGSNNSIIILGTDRAKKGPASVNDGEKGKKTGCVHIIAGRNSSTGDPDFNSDSSFLYLAMSTQGDKNLGSESIQGDSDKGSYAILKSDFVRLSARKNIKLFVGGVYLYIGEDSIVIDCETIKLGKNANQKVILGDNFLNLVYNTHTHPVTSVGSPTGPPIPLATQNNLSENVYV